MLKYIGPFFVALTIAYAGEWGPYYVSLLANGRIAIIGNLSRFSEPCPDAQRNDSLCRVVYRLPKSLFNDVPAHSALGLGFILASTEIGCGETPEKVRDFGALDRSPTHLGALRTYQVVELDNLNCKGDILIKVWSSRLIRRWGHVDSPAVVGDSEWVSRTKTFTEFIRSQVLTALAILVLSILFFNHSLARRMPGLASNVAFFENSAGYLVVFLGLASGMAINLILPLHLGHYLEVRLTTASSVLAHIYPALFFIQSASKCPRRLARFCNWMTTKLGPTPLPRWFTLFVIVYAASSRFGSSLHIVFLSVAITLGFAATRERDLPAGLFALCLLIDALKVMMLPFLPMSLLTPLFMSTLIFANFVARVQNVDKVARGQGSAEVARQVAHDIQSPVLALEVLLSSQHTFPSEQRELISAALERIRGIAKDLVGQGAHARNSLPISLGESISALIEEKRLQWRDRANVTLSKDVPFELSISDEIKKDDFLRVLSNLLNNAVEAIESQGDVSVIARQSGDRIIIEIRDTGIGIAPNVLKTLGTQGATFGKTFGSGLGLSHAFSATKKWGGRLSLESTLGKGTIVSLDIPGRAKPISRT